MQTHKKTIWIDLDNSPHVPFFKPIIKEFEKRGYAITVTARDCYQVCTLADLHHLTYQRIGHHYGKHKTMKGLGTILRAVQMAPAIMNARPDLAVSHGSRSQVMLAKFLRIPSVSIYDYEHTKRIPFLRADLGLIPEVVAGCVRRPRTSGYPGIKEDVYVPNFTPQPGILRQLAIDEHEVVVTVRPPATQAHYFRAESEELFEAAMNWIASHPATRIVMLPRSKDQEDFIREKWADNMAGGKILIPSSVVDGLNLIWHSDLVISGGGTMNREAAALGVPVYSIFRGESGAVDRYLAQKGRLVLIENIDHLRQAVRLEKWQRPAHPDGGSQPAMQYIVNRIEKDFLSK